MIGHWKELEGRYWKHTLSLGSSGVKNDVEKNDGGQEEKEQKDWPYPLKGRDVALKLHGIEIHKVFLNIWNVETCLKILKTIAWKPGISFYFCLHQGFKGETLQEIEKAPEICTLCERTLKSSQKRDLEKKIWHKYLTPYWLNFTIFLSQIEMKCMELNWKTFSESSHLRSQNLSKHENTEGQSKN